MEETNSQSSHTLISLYIFPNGGLARASFEALTCVWDLLRTWSMRIIDRTMAVYDVGIYDEQYSVHSTLGTFFLPTEAHYTFGRGLGLGGVEEATSGFFSSEILRL